MVPPCSEINDNDINIGLHQRDVVVMAGASLMIKSRTQVSRCSANANEYFRGY